MPDPISYQILSAAQSALQAISIAAGYFTDAGTDVKLEVPQEPDGGDVFLVVRAGGFERPTDAAVGKVARVMLIQISAFIPAGMTTAELTLNKILDDIDGAMSIQQALYPERCSFPQFVRAQRIAPAEGLPWVGAHVIYSTTVRRAR